MEVYTASDGGVTQLNKTLSDYDSLENLIQDVSQASGISQENVLLFLDDGRELRNEILQEMWERGGDGIGSSSAMRPALYVYNRETFWTEPERWAVELQEDVQLPPNIEFYSDNIEMPEIQQPFLIAHDHLLHLQSLYQAQTRAVEIAYINLFHHLQPLLRDFSSFVTRAEGDLEEEAKLIRGSKVDMVLLPKVRIHEGFLSGSRRRERVDSMNPANPDGGGGLSEIRSKKNLGDYVSPRKMEEVRKSCRASYENHVERFNHLVVQAEDMAAQSEAQRREADERALLVGQDFAEGLARIETALNQIEILFNSQSDGFEQDILELDQGMRDDLVALTGVKNEYTLHVHEHLRNVANLQIQLNDFVKPLTLLDSDLRSKTAFPHIIRLRQLSFAYGAAVIEVVRRTEFSTSLIDWTSKFADALSQYMAVEKKRRLQYRNEVQANLPWTVVQLDESMSPNVEIAVNGGAESLFSMNISRGDIENLMAWVEVVKDDPEVLEAVEEGDPNPVTVLQSSFVTLIQDMENADGDLQEYMQRRVLAGSSSPQSLDRVRQESHAEIERRLSEVESDHRQRIRQLEDQHDNRTSALQNRQAELQEELFRLRTDLGEEISLREGLAVELENQTREHEEKQREQDDQSDLLTALQADMAQEKDRATDLGVRLQEALLDVDGLKSAEQSLIAQLQELQEERSKSLQHLGEAQLHSKGLESQLAGLQAEMEAVSQQLTQARSDRDAALRNQSAEAERMMRDHIAEADGDRAVLEHQNLTLTKQLEDLKREMDEKLSAAKNAAVRQSDSLTAELKFTKAQLREAQRRETVQADELAMAKDTATSLSQKENHRLDVTKDAVALAVKYHDCNQRIMTAINGSTSMNGSIIKSTNSPERALAEKREDAGKEDLNESVLIKSLATASAFDLDLFYEAVTKILAMVRKYSKKAKQYRDEAKNKIAFSNFTNGDLAMFLPTRNSTAKSWAAFNISAPHNFLKMTDSLQEQAKTREWIIARIAKTEEAVASGGVESPQTNPFGLAEGLRFYTHHVEEYNPATNRPPRRSVSTSYTGNSVSALPATPKAVPSASSAMSRPLGAESAVGIVSPPGVGRPRFTSGYFPPLSQIPLGSTSTSPLKSTFDSADSGTAPVSAITAMPPQSTPLPETPAFDSRLTSQRTSIDQTNAPDDSPDLNISPHIDTTPLPPSTHPSIPPIAVHQPQKPPTTSTHQRTSSRSSYASSPPAFTPFTSNRPPSVTSISHRGHPSPGSYIKSSLAPAMTVTTSSDGSSAAAVIAGKGTPESSHSMSWNRRTLRKTPSTMSLSPSNGTLTALPPGTNTTTLSNLGLPDGKQVTPIATFGNNMGTPPFAKPQPGQEGSVPVPAPASAGGMGPPSQPSRVFGFSIGKKRTTSVSSVERSSAIGSLQKFSK